MGHDSQIQFLTMRHMGHHTFEKLSIRDIWNGHDDPYVVKSFVHIQIKTSNSYLKYNLMICALMNRNCLTIQISYDVFSIIVKNMLNNPNIFCRPQVIITDELTDLNEV